MLFILCNHFCDFFYEQALAIQEEGKKTCRDIIHDEIHITPMAKSNVHPVNYRMKKNSRIFNKMSSCKYCKKLFTNISHHYLNSHKDEQEVARILATKEVGNQKEVSKLWELLRNEGNHNHNLKVVSMKKGELLVVRRNTNEYFCSDDYTNCPQCFGWYLKSALYIHANYRCVARTDVKRRTSSLLIQSQQQRSKDEPDSCDHLFTTMRKDGVTEVAKANCIIRSVGIFFYDKHS